MSEESRARNRVEQTRTQSEAMRKEIGKLGIPTREETRPDGTRRLEFRIGTRTLVRLVHPDGKVTDASDH